MAAPSLSIVVAAHNARVSITACLNELLRQMQFDEAELIVVDNSTDGTSELLASTFPHVRRIEADPDVPIPVLWTLGIQASRGTRVALTTAHCVPSEQWLLMLLEHHTPDRAALGGAIENAPTGSYTDWAVYFCRYVRYMLPLTEAPDLDLPGDNASYLRAALDEVPHTWKEGFWEPTVHDALDERGHALWRTPEVVVYHARSFSIGSFMRNRWQHGTQYGRDRAAGLGLGQWVLYMLRAPLIPALLTARVAREVARRRRHVGRFVRTLPLLVLFYLAWTAGEVRGYLHADAGMG